MKILVVIPAYNEEKNIVPVLRELVEFGYNVIVVNDGSRDKTAEVAKNSGAIVLSHVTNRGQGAALATGTEYALKLGAEVIVHFDADGQFLVKDIEPAIKLIESGQAEIVFGSRFLNEVGEIKAPGSMPKFKRQVIMPLARWFNKVFLGITLTDPQSGFRVLSKKAAERIKWRQDGMAHCSEILVLAVGSGLPISEVPITVIYHHFGQKLSGGVRIIKDIVLSKLIN